MKQDLENLIVRSIISGETLNYNELREKYNTTREEIEKIYKEIRKNKMSNKNYQKQIEFQTYSWMYGTTSFRVSELKYKIEKQLFLIEDLRDLYPESDWKDLQGTYFNLLVGAELSKDSAIEIEKDARQKTSSLKDLGLITEDRKITQIGKLILQTTLGRDNIKFDNIFSLREDNYLYFKQVFKN